MADPFIGHEPGGYRITRLLKRTGMSMIYLAWDVKLQPVRTVRPAYRFSAVNLDKQPSGSQVTVADV